jgi:molybdopterin-dependent oxidoreductase alpha subunit
MKKKELAPEKLTGIELKEPAEYAAGLKGVTTAMDHAIKQMGPVRALATLAKMNQKDGFDCPGCAWPDPDDKRSLLGEYCENGAKALAEEATKKKTGPDFFSKYSLDDLADWSDYELGKSGRLTHPLIYNKELDRYEPIEWESAFKIIAQELKTLHSPDEAVFYTSGRSSNEAAFLWGLFSRAFGTNNMPDCSNMCHESSGVALSQTLGIGKGSVKLDDIENAELVMVIGQNPGTNHPRMLSALQKCKLAGGKVITVNPLEEAGLKRFKNPQKPMDYFTRGTQITDVFLQVRINEDISLLKAIMKLLFQRAEQDPSILDADFISEKTEGFDAFREDLENYELDDLVNRSGVDIKDIQAAVDLVAERDKIIICWAMGLTQHKNGVANIKECVNLLLMKGSIGIKGAGTCPVRGHSNVQGDRTVGIVHHVSPELNKSIKEVFGFDAPEKEGLDTVHAIQAMYEGKAKCFIALGGNFLSAASDTYYTAKALSNCELLVSISTKLNRTHLVTAKTTLVLPTLGRSEKDMKDGRIREVTVENSMGKVHPSKGYLPPASEHLMSEPEIVSRIAYHTLGDKHPVNWLELGSDYALVRDKISQVINGFESYNQRIKKDRGFYLPNNAREADFSKLPNGKAKFSVCSLPEHKLEKQDFLLMTIRSHDQFNTTIYGLDDRYRGVYNERRVVFMHPADMEEYGLKKLDPVDLSSHYDGVERKAFKFLAVPYDIPRRNLAGYFPEMNPLVPINHFADQSQTPISKSIKVRVHHHKS